MMDEKTIQSANVLIDLALAEDIGTGDISTNSFIPQGEIKTACLIAKEDGVVAGLEVFKMVFDRFEKNIEWNAYIKDGCHVKKGDRIIEFKGSYRTLLSGERIALNFLQRMSGIATLTSQFVALTEETKVKILDTRKTLPGYRSLDKYSVKMGGGSNHRMGLYDMVMLKDNHIQIAGGIVPAVEAVRKKIPMSIKIEVETTTIEQVKEAIEARADIIMLDNMTIEQMTEAVKLIDGRAAVEASGNMSLERIREVANTGVDYISIGALTHSVKALDISQRIID
ncbi:MAG: carboxylating nicotinate-nucleotide diphosphorylase [Draconibacterium sp.]|nr:carboxylating nicotinate-nucleotide diphosphorylase [Draconibacterium sp.]